MNLHPHHQVIHQSTESALQAREPKDQSTRLHDTPCDCLCRLPHVISRSWIAGPKHTNATSIGRTVQRPADGDSGPKCGCTASRVCQTLACLADEARDRSDLRISLARPLRHAAGSTAADPFFSVAGVRWRSWLRKPISSIFMTLGRWPRCNARRSLACWLKGWRTDSTGRAEHICSKGRYVSRTLPCLHVSSLFTPDSSASVVAYYLFTMSTSSASSGERHRLSPQQSIEAYTTSTAMGPHNVRHAHYMGLSGSALRTAIGLTAGLSFLAFGYGQGKMVALQESQH